MTTEQWQASRNNLKDAKRWVIKIGSALLTNDGKGLNRQGMQSWVDQIAGLLNGSHGCEPGRRMVLRGLTSGHCWDGRGAARLGACNRR